MSAVCDRASAVNEAVGIGRPKFSLGFLGQNLPTVSRDEKNATVKDQPAHPNAMTQSELRHIRHDRFRRGIAQIEATRQVECARYNRTQKPTGRAAPRGRQSFPSDRPGTWGRSCSAEGA